MTETEFERDRKETGKRKRGGEREDTEDGSNRRERQTKKDSTERKIGFKGRRDRAQKSTRAGSGILRYR